ncbi:hypothetical protein [Streptomyces swartbergensis]|uniref:hypothetical protein n=1 Tax=Streptomyces swartbergensis TaxID=487165 RepID=UPI00117C6AAE|nr:hypothetical protein [Streptomyces swartbergensis]
MGRTRDVPPWAAAAAGGRAAPGTRPAAGDGLLGLGDLAPGPPTGRRVRVRVAADETPLMTDGVTEAGTDGVTEPGTEARTVPAGTAPERSTGSPRS